MKEALVTVTLVGILIAITMGNMLTSRSRDRDSYEDDSLESPNRKLERIYDEHIRTKELEKENQALKDMNQQLVGQLNELKSRVEILENPDLQSRNVSQNNHRIITNVSKAKIREFVEEMLKNPEINLKYFPDAIEKQLYRNVFEMLLSLLDHALNTAEIKFLGHTLTLDLNPVEEDIDILDRRSYTVTPPGTSYNTEE